MLSKRSCSVNCSLGMGRTLSLNEMNLDDIPLKSVKFGDSHESFGDDVES